MIEVKESLRSELILTPEGKLLMAVMIQAITEICGTNTHSRKVSYNWIMKEKNPVADICLILSGYDRHHIENMLIQKFGHDEYYALKGDS